MASDAQERAALAVHPILSTDATGLLGVFRIGITTGSQSIPLPKEMQGKWLDLYNTGSVSVEYGFSIGASASGSITVGQVNSPGGGSAVAGYTIGADKEKSGRIPSAPGQTVNLVLRASAAGGQLVGYVSERTG